MDLKIDEIMDMSLDDYIALSKKYTNSDVMKDSHLKTKIDDCGKDTKFGRRKGNIDDEEEDEDDVFMQTAEEELEEETHNDEVCDEVWKGPDSSISYLDCQDRKSDLREKLNNSNKKNYTDISNVQYRMMAPNNGANRPRGIPTLLPLDAHVNNGNWIHNKGNRRNGRKWKNRGYNFQRGFNNIANVNNNSNLGNGGSVNNGRVQRNRKQDIESKNLRFSVTEKNSNRNSINDSMNMETKARNMIIETPSRCINLVPSPPLNSSFQVPQHTAFEHDNNSTQSLPIGNLTPQAEAVLNLNSMGSQNTSLAAGNRNENLKTFLGFQGNMSEEMMPLFASRLMEYIQGGLRNPVVHKPVYDMKIQKDIHEIQKKPLLYKCPGGEVVSSDGPGVNCKIIPRTSGLSLNCRFA